MSSGRKARAGGLRRPPRGYYQGAMAVLDAVLAGRVTPQAGYLWQVIRAYSFYEGCCTMTDVELGRHMGGMTGRQVVNLRAGLRAAGLLQETLGPAGSNERRLVALPVQPSGRQPGGVGIDMKSSSHEIHFMSIGQEEEEELINALKPDLLKPPPPLPGKRARAAVGRKCISGQTDFTSNQVRVNSAAHLSGAGQSSAAGQALAQYMIAHGVFPRIAAELAPSFLARQDLADAKTEVLAWWFSVTEGEEIRASRTATTSACARDSSCVCARPSRGASARRCARWARRWTPGASTRRR
jgi:hypothetical protein